MAKEKVIEPEKIETENESHETKPKKKSSFVKYILNIILVLTVTGVTVGITFAMEGSAIIQASKNMHWEWVAASFACVFLAFLFRAIIYYCFARLYTKKYSIFSAAALDQIGVFYSGVTPGASGGQFMQAYTYKKQGLPISAGASIMVMASIIYQIVLIIYGILSLSIRFDLILQIAPAFKAEIGGVSMNLPIIPFIVAGFIINLSVIGILLLMSYSKKFHHFMCGPMITFLAFCHIVKDKEHASESLRIQVENFKIELKRLLSNIPFSILIGVLFFIVLGCQFAVPCFVGKALGATYDITFVSIWDTIFMSNFHQMVSGLIPIPGGAGVSELFFFSLFDGFYGKVNDVSITAAAQLMWRTLTFTVPLVIGGLVSAFYRCSPKEEVTRRDLNMQTFVALQHETYIEREATMQEAQYTSRLTRQAILSSLKLRDKKDKEKEIEKKKEKEKQIQREIKEFHEQANLNDDEIEWKEMNIGDDEEDV